MAQSKPQVWVFVEQRSGKPADVSFEFFPRDAN